MQGTFEFEIIPDNGSERFRVDAGMRDLRMWEKTHRGRGLGLLSEKSNITATVMFEIAYAACRRQGMIPASLTSDQFAEQYDIDVIDSDPAEEPPAPDAPAGEDTDPGAPGFTR